MLSTETAPNSTIQKVRCERLWKSWVVVHETNGEAIAMVARTRFGLHLTTELHIVVIFLTLEET